MSKETGGSAYPIPKLLADGWSGMTLRQYAAIKLKVPDSGTNWLDDMILKSLRDDFAAKAMQGFCASAQEGRYYNSKQCADRSYEFADAMLEARK